MEKETIMRYEDTSSADSVKAFVDKATAELNRWYKDTLEEDGVVYLKDYVHMAYELLGIDLSKDTLDYIAKKTNMDGVGNIDTTK